MKSKLMRIISTILILSSLLSMLAIFATAETAGAGTAEEEEDDDYIELLYQRTFEEGWDIENGLYLAEGGRGSNFTIDYEETLDYQYNYFFRLEVMSNLNGYVQQDFDNYSNKGVVLEMDVKSDDVTQISNVLQFGTVGGTSAQRTNYNLMSVLNNDVYFMTNSPNFTDHATSDEPAFTLTNEWKRLRFIFDYTYEKEPILEDDSIAEVTRKEEENAKWFQLYIYYGDPDDEELTLWLGEPLVLYGQNGKGLNLMRYGTSGEKEENFGTSICFDNITAYRGTNKVTDVSDMGYGIKVDPYYDITEEIKGGAASVSAPLYQTLAMKLGVDNCYFGGTKRVIATNADGEAYGAPFEKDGVIYISLDTVLEYIGYPYYIHPDGQYIDVSTGTSTTYLVVGKKTATVNSQTVVLTAAPAYMTDEDGNEMLVIAGQDVDVLFPGFYYDYDDMGLLTVSDTYDVMDRRTNLSTMVNLMKKFIFTVEDSVNVYDHVNENTDGFQHPYLYMTQSDMDLMYNEYQELNETFAVLNDDTLTDEEYYALEAELSQRDDYMLWIHYERLVYYAEAYYGWYAYEEGGEYKRLLSDEEAAATGARGEHYSIGQQYLSNGGYDVGGRSFPSNRTSRLRDFAIGYILTKDIKYLRVAYDLALAMGEWTHWGPGHFLNCADASLPYALYFDWTYNAYVELAENNILRPDGTAYDVNELAEILAEQGVHEGYLACNLQITDHVSTVVGTGGSLYLARTNNWHAVCTGGMVTASLAIIGEQDGKYKEEASFVISESICALVENGLDMYAPDGSYIEGPGYWEYGTNAFFKLCLALDTAVGHDYGLMETWGIDTTCYFASHVESNDGQAFIYHDATYGESVDTSMFFYVAKTFGDVTLYNVRYNQIESNFKSADIIDLIFYPRDIDITADDIELDYYSDSIDLFTSRSSWESGALYVAMIGGDNNITHGQIDAGDFEYHNGGRSWIVDIGTEEYNCAGFWPDATRYRFYRMKPEGNNTLALASDSANIPYGQLLESEAYATAYESNEFGAYVVYNMTSTMGNRVNKWERGMLVTNDRTTTIVQDEISFNSMQTVYWFAHYDTRYIKDIVISSDGRTAYMIRVSGKDEYGVNQYQVLRLSIVSTRKDYNFEIWDCYTFVHNDKLTGTYVKDYIATQGSGVAERDRSIYNKLVISGEATIDFNVAVAIEMIDYESYLNNDEIDVGYTFTSMKNWESTDDYRDLDIEEDTDDKRGVANISTHIRNSKYFIDMYRENGTSYTSNMAYYYRCLTDAYYAIRMIGRDMPDAYSDTVKAIKEYREEYGAFVEEANRVGDVYSGLVHNLMGI